MNLHRWIMTDTHAFLPSWILTDTPDATQVRNGACCIERKRANDKRVFPAQLISGARTLSSVSYVIGWHVFVTCVGRLVQVRSLSRYPKSYPEWKLIHVTFGISTNPDVMSSSPKCSTSIPLRSCSWNMTKRGGTISRVSAVGNDNCLCKCSIIF